MSRGREADWGEAEFLFSCFFPRPDLLLLASLDSLSTPVSFSLLSKTADDNRSCKSRGIQNRNRASLYFTLKGIK